MVLRVDDCKLHGGCPSLPSLDQRGLVSRGFRSLKPGNSPSEIVQGDALSDLALLRR